MTGIEGFVIKIGKKEKDDSTIRDVVIYEQNGGNQDNVIIADSGKMVVTPDKQSLAFILKSGSAYQWRRLTVWRPCTAPARPDVV